MEGEWPYAFWVTPERDGKAEYLVSKGRFFSNGFRTLGHGTVIRSSGANPDSIDLLLNDRGRKVHLVANVISIPGLQGLTPVLDGTVKVGRKTMDVRCSYDTRAWMQDYNRLYDPRFPAELYYRFYGITDQPSSIQ